MTNIKLAIAGAWRRFRAWVVTLLVAVGLVAGGAALAGTKDFSWTNPTQRVDGTAFDPATEQAETRIYCNGDATPTFVATGAETFYRATMLPGSYSCYATVVDNNGFESDPSNTVDFIVELERPNPPILTAN